MLLKASTQNITKEIIDYRKIKTRIYLNRNCYGFYMYPLV